MEDLTPRQSETAALMAQGLTSQAIADRMGISPLTVRTHEKEVMSKLFLNTRSQVAAWWWQRRINELQTENAMLREAAETIRRAA